MRRGQSSVEPMLAITAVVLVAVAVAYWQIDALVPRVQAVADWVQTTPHFEPVIRVLEGR